jgi:hypothetical protein
MNRRALLTGCPRRPVYEGRGAIRITGSPFETFDEAEAACDAMLQHLISEN